MATRGTVTDTAMRAPLDTPDVALTNTMVGASCTSMGTVWPDDSVRLCRLLTMCPMKAIEAGNLLTDDEWNVAVAMQLLPGSSWMVMLASEELVLAARIALSGLTTSDMHDVAVRVVRLRLTRTAGSELGGRGGEEGDGGGEDGGGGGGWSGGERGGWR